MLKTSHVAHPHPCSPSLYRRFRLFERPKNNTVAPAPQTLPTLEQANELEPYRMQIGDVIDVKLMLNPELNDQITVRPDGMISTTVAQDVPAYGRTPGELRDDLVNQYKQFLTDPHITVMLRSFAPNRVYVAGEVNNPGEFITVGPNLTLLQAIARAGGVKNSAQTDKIIILRRGASEAPKAYAANYTAAASGTSPGSDVRLASYDVVYVPRSDVGDVYLHYQQYLQQFLPPSFGLGYQLNNSAR